MKIGSWIIILGFLGLFLTLGRFLLFGSPIDIFTSSFGTYAIVAGLALKKEKVDNIYYFAFLCIIIFQGLTLTYITFLTDYKTEIILYFGIFIVFVTIFVYTFINRHKYAEKLEKMN